MSIKGFSWHLMLEPNCLTLMSLRETLNGILMLCCLRWLRFYALICNAV